MSNVSNKRDRLPREVWAAAISLKGLWPEETIAKRIKKVLERMENVYPFEPDIICLPETVNISWVKESVSLGEIAEDESSPGPVTSQLAEIARRQNCYITCPIITKKDGRFYNSAILINRRGGIDGVFHKIHPTDTEIIPETYYKGGGVTPGTLQPPVFKTDFGTVGIQICMDASWDDGWQHLRSRGAEVVLFLSQADYGDDLRNHAWRNHYDIVSSTGEDARIIDRVGNLIALDSELARWVCSSINLEKAVVDTRPHLEKFGSMQKKYGRKIAIRIYNRERWATIESRDPEIRVNDVLKEFGVPGFDEQIAEATSIQNKYRA